MKLRRTILLAIGGLFLLTGSARAVTVDLTGHNDALGLVVLGQTGTIDNKINKGHGEIWEGAAIGELPPESEIVFTYTFIGYSGKKGDLIAEARYRETVGPLKYSAFSSSEGGSFSHVTNTITHHRHHVPSPILATADLGYHQKTGTTTIINTSDVDVSFESYFEIYYRNLCGKGGVVVNYIVTSLDPSDPAATPLPASLPLLGAALIFLFGFGRLKNSRSRVLLVK